MTELWQVYNDQAEAVPGHGITKDEAATGILHGASHVWIWRRGESGIEILLQKRAATKRTWPNRLDISAAGHIDLDEAPLQAAVRETSEELGYGIDTAALSYLDRYKAYIEAENGIIENEFQWRYLLQLSSDVRFTLQGTEVDSVVWCPLSTFETDYSSPQYVPHGEDYYSTLLAAIKVAGN